MSSDHIFQPEDYPWLSEFNNAFEVDFPAVYLSADEDERGVRLLYLAEAFEMAPPDTLIEPAVVAFQGRPGEWCSYEKGDVYFDRADIAVKAMASTEFQLSVLVLNADTGVDPKTAAADIKAFVASLKTDAQASITIAELNDPGKREKAALAVIQKHGGVLLNAELETQITCTERALIKVGKYCEAWEEHGSPIEHAPSVPYNGHKLLNPFVNPEHETYVNHLNETETVTNHNPYKTFGRDFLTWREQAKEMILQNPDRFSLGHDEMYLIELGAHHSVERLAEETSLCLEGLDLSELPASQPIEPARYKGPTQ